MDYPDMSTKFSYRYHGSMWPSLFATGLHIVPFFVYVYTMWFHAAAYTPRRTSIFSVSWVIIWRAGVPPPPNHKVCFQRWDAALLLMCFEMWVWCIMHVLRQYGEDKLIIMGDNFTAGEGIDSTWWRWTYTQRSMAFSLQTYVYICCKYYM
jgi:hypothetical protein